MKKLDRGQVLQATELIRPSSSASLNKGVQSIEDDIPRAASVEAELIFGTIPNKKKKKRKWSGIKKISSPLFRNRRKSFTHSSTPSQSTSSIALSSMSNHTLPVATTGHSSHSSSRTSLHETPPPLATMLPASNVSEETDSNKGRASGVNDILEVAAGNLHKPLSMLSKRGRGKEECFKALRVMAALSSNTECLSTLVSYICLPKCVSK